MEPLTNTEHWLDRATRGDWRGVADRELMGMLLDGGRRIDKRVAGPVIVRLFEKAESIARRELSGSTTRVELCIVFVLEKLTAAIYEPDAADAGNFRRRFAGTVVARAIDATRKHSGLDMEEPIDASDGDRDPSPKPAMEGEADEDWMGKARDTVADHLEAMPDGEARTALVLRLGNKGLKDIAEHLKCSKSTASARIRDGQVWIMTSLGVPLAEIAQRLEISIPAAKAHLRAANKPKDDGRAAG